MKDSRNTSKSAASSDSGATRSSRWAARRCDEVDVSWHGLAGDRRWAFVRDGVSQSGFPWLTLREREDMSHYRPSFVEPERPDTSPTRRADARRASILDVTDPALARGALPERSSDHPAGPRHLRHVPAVPDHDADDRRARRDSSARPLDVAAISTEPPGRSRRGRALPRGRLGRRRPARRRARACASTSATAAASSSRSIPRRPSATRRSCAPWRGTGRVAWASTARPSSRAASPSRTPCSLTLPDERVLIRLPGIGIIPGSGRTGARL